MKILADYHTHTKYSHGLGSIEENIKVAISKGIATIGISDHGYKHLTYGVKKKDIYLMREEIDSLKSKYKDINILLGMECNILDEHGNIDIDDEIRDICDYVMAGYHFGSSPTSMRGTLNHMMNFANSKNLLRNEKAKEYNTKAVVNAIKNNDIFILTHPGDKGEVYIEEVAKAAKKYNTMLEINSSHGYLTVEQLRKIKHIGNEFVIGSDAHVPDNVGNFELALKNIKKADINMESIKNIEV